VLEPPDPLVFGSWGFYHRTPPKLPHSKILAKPLAGGLVLLCEVWQIFFVDTET